MAFAKQYYSSYKSNNGLDYYLEIWVDGFSGNASEITLGAGGPVISYDTEQEDRFSPIISSQCVLPFMVKGVGTQSFIQLLRTTYQERQVYLHLYRATSSTYSTVKPLWSGYLIMDLGSGEDVSFPYEQNLTFVDGLSVLKEIDFVQFPEGSPPSTPSDPNPIPFEDRTLGNYAPENMYWGPARYTYWIKEILLKSGAATTSQGASLDYGFTTAVNWYNGVMTSTSQSSDPLYLTESQASMFHTKDENNFFKPENCYEVLKELMRHWGCRITYWKHEFWIVQIPEYIEDESGFIDNPDNINSRQYNKSGTYLGSQDHLGDTYYTRYEQTIQSNQISKLVGTKYNYLPAIHRADATFLSLNSENHYGGFPFGSNATTKDIFQGRILNPSNADFLWISVPLNWEWDMTGADTTLQGGHVKGWWCSIKFNLYAFQKIGNTTTTYYLQYNSSSGNYYWIEEANWVPLGNTSPKYIIKSHSLTETDYIGFQEQIPFEDSSGNAISMTGQWDFYMSLEDYGTSSSTPGSFYCRFSGYQPSNFYSYIKRNPNDTTPYLPTTGNVSGSGPQSISGKVSWTNSLQDNTLAQATPNIQQYPSSYNTGSSYNMDIKYNFVSPLKGFLQVLTTSQNSTYGFTNNTQITNSTNTESFSFGDLVWGDTVQSTARGMLGVYNGSDFVKTNPTGQWGRGTLTGTQTFTQILIDEFLTGQIKVLISPNMRLVVGEQNKDQTATASGGGTATRPRFVNPIGRLREFRTNAYDPEYIFRRGSFYSLFDEWDYEGYEILRDTITVTTVTNDIGGLGGAQDDAPIASAKLQGPVTSALMMNSPVAYVRQTVAATGSNVAVNGNFNVATGWTLGTGWSIDTTAKKANFTATGSTSDLTQSVLTQEKTFQINFTVVVTAGTLLVKAGSSGTTETITASGDYSIYLDCEGSSVIKFQAGTTFTGSITHVHIAEQKSLSSLPINSLGTTVFKTNDTFNLINSKGGEILPLTVSSNQGASDDTISVTSTALYDDIGIDSVLLINQDDLSAQYQNKTKGTVGGFDITATSIDSGSVAISSYIDDDSFGTASATSLATSESIKAYVDTQVGSADTLQEVTDNGNTTTNSINIGSSTAPAKKLTVTTSATGDGILGISTDGYTWCRLLNDNSTTTPVGTLRLYYGTSQSVKLTALSNQMKLGDSQNTMTFFTASSERMRLTSTGLGIGTTSPSAKLNINTGLWGTALKINSTTNTAYNWNLNQISPGTFVINEGYNNTDMLAITSGGNVGINQVNPTEKLHVVGDALITGDSHADTFKPAVSGNPIKFKNFDSSTEFARITNAGNLLLGTTTTYYAGTLLGVGDTSDSQNGLQITTSTTGNGYILFGDGTSADAYRGEIRYAHSTDTLMIKAGGTNILNLTGTTATFSGQVTIPATPVASTDAASKGYVDAQIGANNDLQEVTDNGNTTTNSITFAGGTSTGDITGENITLGDGSTDRQLKVYYSNVSDFVNVKGYGVEFNRTSSYLRPTSANSKYMYFGNPTLYWIQIESNAVTHKWTNASSEKMRLTSAGYLGIGQTSPAHKLDVAGYIRSANTGADSNTKYSQFLGRHYTNSEEDILAISTESTSSSNNIYIGGGFSSRNSATTIKFSTASNNTTTTGSERMRVINTGNLLIGTTTDDGSSKLQVNGKGYFNGNVIIENNKELRWKDSSGNERTILELTNANDLYFGGSFAGSLIFIGGGSYTERARISDSGNFLIGTTTDSAKLTVDETTTNNLTVAHFKHNQGGVISNLLLENSAGANDTGFSFDFRLASSGTSAKIGAIRTNSPSAGDTDMFFSTSTNGTSVSEAMRITSSSNVLIGTTTDSGEKLVVDGDIKINDNTIKIGINNDLLIYHDGSNSYIKEVGTGTLRLQTDGTGIDFYKNSTEFLARLITDGAVELYYDSVKKFETTSSGISITGGGIFTDQVTIPATPVASTDAASKGYVDAQIGANNDLQEITDNGATTTNDMTISNGAPAMILKDSTSGSSTVIARNSFRNNVNTEIGTIGFLGDGNLRLTNILSNNITFYTSNAEKMRLTSGGNLLIGTTTDSGAKLNVQGSLQVGVDDTGYDVTFYGDTSGRNMLWDTSYNGLILSDNTKLQLGSSTGSGDLQLLHNGTDSYIQNQIGQLYINQNVNDGDIVLQCDDGSGGITPYITLDGSQATVNVYKTLLIGTTTNTGAYKIDVAGKQRVQDTLELDDVLMLNAISTPSDPAAGKSVIYMDSSDGGIKCKINVGGTVVTRTIASFE